MSLRLVINSVGVAAVSTAMALVFAIPVVLWLGFASRRVAKGLLALLVMVLALPAFFVAGMWMESVGFAGAWRVGGGEWTTRWMPMLMSSWVLALLLWPVPALLVSGAWERVDGRLLEAHPDLRGLSFLRHAWWPVAGGAVGQGIALTAALALGNFAVPSLFQARIWPEEIWVEFSTRFDATAAWMKSWPLMLIALALAAYALRQPLHAPRRDGRPADSLVRSRLGRPCRAFAHAGTVAIAGLSLVYPLAMAGGMSRTWTELPGAFAAAWPALLRSILYAGATATLVLAVGWWLCRRRWPWVLAIAFFLPGIFVGITLLRTFDVLPFPVLREGAGVVVLALVLRYAFVGWFVAARLWRSADRGLVEVSRLAGAGRIVEWRHAVLPGAAASVGGAWLLVYLLALWDVETLVLIVPPGGDSLSLMVFNLLHYGHNAQVSALCVLLGASAVAPVIGWAAAGLPGALRRRAAAAVSSLALLPLFLGVGCKPAASPTHAEVNSALFASVDVLGTRGNGVGQFQKPRSLTVDGGDNLYVVDMTGRVQKFDHAGHCVLSWQMPETDKGKAKGMATAPDGTVLVVEPHYHRVNRFDAEGRLLAQWGDHGTNAGQLWFPRAIAVAADGGCFISEYGRVERVQHFAADGAVFLNSFGDEGTAPGRLNRAEGLGLDAQGNVHVADSCNHRVQVFAPDGRLLRVLGRAGQGAGEFSYPYDVRVDAAGFQFVCEFGNSRVQIFDATDRPLESLGGAGTAPDRMNNPWSICLDSRGNLYVADSLNHRVLRFNRRTQLAAVAAAPSTSQRSP